MTDWSETHFFIENGVHRSMAARVLGLMGVLGTLNREGHEPELVFVRLDQLHSVKRKIARYYKRGSDFNRLLNVMSTAEGRARLPTISLQLLGADNQPPSIPLAEVEIDYEGGPDDEY